MKPTRLLLALTVVNLGLLGYQVVRVPEARAQDEPQVLRGRGIEIVDGDGRLRAQLKVEPGDPAYRWPGGDRVGYPETVIFRLITADGKPRVKLTTSDRGSGLLLLGDSDETQTVLHADGSRASLKLRNGEKKERILEP